EVCQIRGTHGATESGRSFDDGLCYFSLVEGVTALLRDQLQSFCEIRIAERVAELRRMITPQEDAPCFVVFLELRRSINPIGMDDLRDPISVLGVVDGRSKKVFPWKLAKALVGLAPSLHRSRDSHAVDALARHGFDSMLSQELRGQFLWRPAAGVKTVKFAGLRVPVKEKQIAAHPVHHGFGDSKECVGRDRRVHGGTTSCQDLRAGLRRKVMRGGNNAAIGDHHGSTVRAVLGMYFNQGYNTDYAQQDKANHQALTNGNPQALHYRSVTGGRYCVYTSLFRATTNPDGLVRFSRTPSCTSFCSHNFVCAPETCSSSAISDSFFGVASNSIRISRTLSSKSSAGSCFGCEPLSV